MQLRQHPGSSPETPPENTSPDMAEALQRLIQQASTSAATAPKTPTSPNDAYLNDVLKVIETLLHSNSAQSVRLLQETFKLTPDRLTQLQNVAHDPQLLADHGMRLLLDTEAGQKLHQAGKSKRHRWAMEKALKAALPDGMEAQALALLNRFFALPLSTTPARPAIAANPFATSAPNRMLPDMADSLTF
jgi:hypothetical protein